MFHMEQLADLETAVAERVAQAIEASGQPLTEVCRKSGIARTTMYRALDGHASFTVRQLAAIARACSVDPASLIPRTDAA